MGLQAAYSSNQLNPCANGSLCVVLVRLWVAKVDENTVAHVLGYEATEALHSLSDTLLIAADKLAKVFRVHTG